MLLARLNENSTALFCTYNFCCGTGYRQRKINFKRLHRCRREREELLKSRTRCQINLLIVSTEIGALLNTETALFSFLFFFYETQKQHFFFCMVILLISFPMERKPEEAGGQLESAQVRSRATSLHTSIKLLIGLFISIASFLNRS